jgi:hypothetical protein
MLNVASLGKWEVHGHFMVSYLFIYGLFNDAVNGSDYTA